MSHDVLGEHVRGFVHFPYIDAPVDAARFEPYGEMTAVLPGYAPSAAQTAALNAFFAR